ncbi:MAG: MFS transporter [Acaryochloridaceae cyanobacterium CSU_5_19]|nr:MFS transporter [Acaryochloridaceae cyanobacterium CSU_5_19]
MAVLIEPLFGSLSDRQRTLWGLRAPFTTLGVLLASALLLVLPSVVLLGDPESALRWLFIALVILWSMAMAMFRSPMLARLGEFACQRDWPYAASVLTLVGTIAATLALPASKEVVKGLGPGPAFAISSIILLISATLLNWTQPAQTHLPELISDQQQPSAQNLCLVALTGSTITLAVILTQQLIGLVDKTQAPLLLTFFLVVQLITVLPIGWLAQRWGSLQTMIVGLVLLGLGFSTLIVPVPLIRSLAILFLGIGMGGVGVATIPFALYMVPLSRGGLGIGCYFGGAALAGAFFNVYMSRAIQLPLVPGWIVGLFSMMGAIAILWMCRTRIHPPPRGISSFQELPN